MLAILVANSKGGCGKTTIATNLASAYAAGGFRVALADADPQKSAFRWCRRRPDRAPPVMGLDWSKKIGDVDPAIQRLIIDGPAALGVAHFKDLLKMADAVVLPVLPSAFDRDATARFIKRIEDVKPIRKNLKPVGLVANMVRTGGRAARHLIEHLNGIGYPPVCALRYRAVYADVAENGLGIFDRRDKVALGLQMEWTPLITYVETLNNESG